MQYKVISPVQKDGAPLGIGTLIDLKKEDALKLIEAGAVEEAHRPYEINALRLDLSIIPNQD